MIKDKNKLKPDLCFPEFVNDGDWNVTNLGELCEYWNGASHENGVSDVGDYYLISLNSIDIDGNLKSKMKRLSYTDNSLQKNDLIMVLSDVAHGNFLGLTDIIPNGKYVLNQRMAGLRIKDSSQAISFFLRAYINKNQKYFKTKGQGSSQLNLSKSSVTEFPVLKPKNINEQKKIAECLSSLDDIIAAHKKKVDILIDYKKGLMQNLFPQEGETVPKWRFKDFEKDGDWIFEQFDKVYSFLVTNSFSRENLNYVTGSVKNIHYGDIHTKFSTLFDIAKEKVPYINSDLSIDRIRQECYCKEGDIIFADASEDLNDVGKSIEIVNLNNERLLSGLHTLLARQIELKLVTGFGGHLFFSNKIRNQIKREAQGAKVLGISGTRISNITIYYPKNKKEQQKIASCLSALDELITAQTEKIEQLKLHKKGLMQGLFPKVID
jgi:type I restriction enzyme S subunit